MDVVKPMQKMIPIATLRLFVKKKAVNKPKSNTCAILKRITLPYISARRGIHKSEKHHPMKKEDPIIPILNFGSHIISNFYCQLLIDSWLSQSICQERIFGLPAQIYSAVHIEFISSEGSVS